MPPSPICRRTSDLLALRGTCRARQGELSAGIQDLATAVMLKPQDWELLNSFAIHLQQMKMFDEAVVFHVKAINNSEPEQHPQLYINLGLAMTGQGDHKAAAELFEAVLAVHPDMIDAAVNLSSVLNSLKEYARSVEACRRTLALVEAPQLYHNMGNALHRIPGRDADAVKAFERAVELDPTNLKSKHMLRPAPGRGHGVDPPPTSWPGCSTITPATTSRTSSRSCATACRVSSAATC